MVHFALHYMSNAAVAAYFSALAKRITRSGLGFGSSCCVRCVASKHSRGNDNKCVCVLGGSEREHEVGGDHDTDLGQLETD